LIEGRQRRQHAGDDRHRVSVGGERDVEAPQVLVNQRMTHQAMAEIFVLLLGRQLAVDNQEGGLEKRRALGEEQLRHGLPHDVAPSDDDGAGAGKVHICLFQVSRWRQ